MPQHKTVEPHLLHKFEADFYGSHLKFLITGYLRPELDFTSLEALVEAIQNDIAQADEWLALPQGKSWAADEFLTN
jgi:riboflavin kinase